MSNAEEVIEELPASLVQAQAVVSGPRNGLVADGLNPIEKKIYELLSAEESPPMDDLVETSGLNSSQVLATLFSRERNPAAVAGKTT